MQRLGPYTSEKTANAVARAFMNLGETVRVEEVYEPFQPAGKQYRAYIVREVSA
jgi:hypothetical protein